MQHLNNWQYKIALQFRYFEVGLGKLNYAKYIVALGSAGEALVRENIANGIYILLAFGVVVYLLGAWWFKKGLYEAEQEVNNQYNLFVKEMRSIVEEMHQILKTNARTKTNM